MDSLKEFGWAIGRIILGIVIFIGGLAVLNLIVYISVTGNTFGEEVAEAYSDGYDRAYTQAYDVGYQEIYSGAYDRGYSEGYEIGLGVGPEEEVSTRVELRNPTYKELREFLTHDNTDSNLYIPGEYACFDYTAALNNNAEVNGIRTAYVRIRFGEWAHALVAFETVDRGLVFVEPQSDKEVRLVVGEPYPWLSSGAVRTTGYDDTIVEIQLIW
ncbi:hypothetical protein ACFLUJ_01700 [Chloroflexota bacterium]